MRKNKILEVLLSLSLVVSLITVSVSASSQYSSAEVYADEPYGKKATAVHLNTVFSTDFEDFTVFDSTENMRHSLSDEEHGNSYSIKDWEQYSKWSKTFDQDITDGVMTFSFDTYYTDKSKFTDILTFNTGNIWNNNTPYRAFLAYRSSVNGLMGLTTGENSWDLEAGAFDYQTGQWYHVDIVIDLNKTNADNSILKMYINGELIMSKDIGFRFTRVGGFEYTVENIDANPGTHYIDNMTVTVNNSENISVLPEYANGYTDLVFDETIANMDDINTGSVTIERQGEQINVSGVKNIDYNTLRIMHDGMLSDSDFYTINLSVSPVSINGKKLISDSIVNENYVFNEGKLPDSIRFISDFEDVSVFDTNENIQTSVFDSNYGNSYSIKDWQTYGKWSKTFDQDITDGVMTFSFDTYYTDKSKFTDILTFNTGNIWNNNTPYRAFLAYRSSVNGLMGLTTGENSWDLEAGAFDYQTGQWYHVDIVIDLNKTNADNSILKMYINGELIMSKDIGFRFTRVGGFEFTVENADANMGAHYIDNMTVAVNNEGDFEAGITFEKGASNIIFSESSADIENLDVGDIILRKNGESVNINNVTVLSSSAVKIEYDGYISDKDVYEVILPEGITSIHANTLKNNNVTNLINIESITVKDSADNVKELADTVSADTKEIIFTFDNKISGSDFENALSIRNEAGEAVYTGSYNETDNTYTVSLPEYLIGNSEYTIEIASGASLIPMTKTFKTEEGKITIKNIAFYSGDTKLTSLDGISGKITLRADVTNTSGTEKTYSLSYGVYSGAQMLDMDFTEGVIAGDKYDTSIELTLDIPNVSGAEIRGYIWDGISSMTPYTNSWAQIN